MSKHLQQLNDRTEQTSRAAGHVVGALELKANIAPLLLVLVIIPTLSGVAWIA